MTALVDEARGIDFGRSSLVSATSDDLSGRAYYYYYSRPTSSNQASDSAKETAASSAEELSDEANNGTIKIYVDSGQFQAPYFSFYADSSRSIAFGAKELDVSKTYEFIAANFYHPFYVGDNGYRKDSSAALVLEGDGSASSGIGRDESFTLKFASDIDLSVIDSINYFCTHHASMIGAFKLVGEPLGGQDSNEDDEIVVPTITISTDDTSLTLGETAKITFRLSQNSIDFTADDVSVSGGDLSGFDAISAMEYTAVFTPDANSTDNGTVVVAAGRFSNSSGTTNNSRVSLAMRVDTRDLIPPVLTMTASDDQLVVDETATIRFSLSEASSDFTADDVTVSGGALSGFSGSGMEYSASFTPVENSTDDGVITVGRGAFADAAGNANGEQTSISLEVNTVPPDTTAPVLTMTASDDQLVVDETATIRFSLSEASSDFTADDVVVSGGALSGFSGSGMEYSASFTPSENSTDDGVITVGRGAFADAAGNANGEQTSISLEVNTVPPDTTAPVLTMTASDDQLVVDETATIRFSLSEASSDFTADDVVVSGGALSGFSGSGMEYSASFTPVENSTDDGVITVGRGAFADAAGNANGEETSISLEVNTVPPDTTAPVLTMTASDDQLVVDETATIRFSLSEASSDFTADDVTVSGGALSGFSGSGMEYSASFTPVENSTEDGVITVGRGAFADAAGNANGEQTSISLEVNTVPPDTTAPVLTMTASDDQLVVDETATIRFSLSEASSDFTADDVVVSGGTLSGFSGSGMEYSASFTPLENSTDDGVITVGRGAFADAAGNANGEQTSISVEVNTVPPDTTAPVLTMTASDDQLVVDETATIRFSLSEASSDFTADDVVVSGGTLSGFSGSGMEYSASFTPVKNSTDDGVITVGEVRSLMRQGMPMVSRRRSAWR